MKTVAYSAIAFVIALLLPILEKVIKVKLNKKDVEKDENGKEK